MIMANPTAGNVVETALTAMLIISPVLVPPLVTPWIREPITAVIRNIGINANLPQGT